MLPSSEMAGSGTGFTVVMRTRAWEVMSDQGLKMVLDHEVPRVKPSWVVGLSACRIPYQPFPVGTV